MLLELPLTACLSPQDLWLDDGSRRQKPAIAIATDSRMSEIAEASRLPYINVSLQFEQTNISLKSPLNMVWYRFPHPEGPRPGIDWRQIISQVGFLIA